MPRPITAWADATGMTVSMHYVSCTCYHHSMLMCSSYSNIRSTAAGGGKAPRSGVVMPVVTVRKLTVFSLSKRRPRRGQRTQDRFDTIKLMCIGCLSCVLCPLRGRR